MNQASVKIGINNLAKPVCTKRYGVDSCERDEIVKVTLKDLMIVLYRKQIVSKNDSFTLPEYTFLCFLNIHFFATRKITEGPLPHKYCAKSKSYSRRTYVLLIGAFN